MAELTRFQVIALPDFRLVGKELTVSPFGSDPIPAFWDACLTDGTFPLLRSMKDALCQEILPNGKEAAVRWIGGLREDGSFTCFAGMLMRPGTLPPEGFSFQDVSACRVAAGQINGTAPEIYAEETDLMLPEMEKLGLVPDSFSMEVFPCPLHNPNASISLGYYLQIR